MSEEYQGTPHQITVRTNETTIEVRGPRNFVTTEFEELADRYLETDSGGKTPSPEADSSESLSAGEKVRTLSELAREIDLPYKRDAALLTGWYIERIDGNAPFTRAAIETRANESKLELGANLSRDVNVLIEKGLLMKAGDQDGTTAYQTALTGEERVTWTLGVENAL